MRKEVVILTCLAVTTMFSCKDDEKDKTVNLAAIGGVTAPVAGASPTATISETAQYSGSISWMPAVSGTFAYSTAYTSTITLTAKEGYTFQGVAENFFTVAGATATNAANSGTVTAVFPATSIPPVTEITVTVATGTYVYTGSAIEPTVTVKTGETTLAASDYDLTYSNNINAGTEAKVTATGKGTYAGKTAEATFNITPRVATLKITVTGEYTYNGAAQTPDPANITVKWDETALTADTEYTLTYRDNIIAGAAIVTVSGAGNFAGSTGSGEFTIDPCPININADDKSKSIGEADPPLTYSVTPSLFVTDAFTGALTRELGENEGTYAITQGTLTAGNNYEINFTPGVFTVQGYFCGGSGTSGDPYLICTAAQLAKMSELVNGKATNSEYGNKYYKLTADIDISAYGKDWNNGKGWIPIGKFMSSQADRYPFIGYFDGDNRKVSGLFMNVDNLSTCNGLFGYMTGGSLQNLGVSGTVTGGGLTGGLVGQTHIVSITNCYAAVTVNGFDNVGGLVGQSDGNITNCYATGAVSGVSTKVGGLAGVSSGSINNCFSTGNVSSSVGDAGGVVGYLIESGSVINCYATGDVSGFSSVGGLVGFIMRNEGSVINCYATGAVNGGGYGIRGGGVVGNNNGGISSVANCAALNPSITNTGSLPSFGRVTGFSYFGGTNNVAWNGMKAIGGITFGAGSAGNNDGADITAEQAIVENTYKVDLSWKFGNNDANPWQMGAGEYKLPVFYWQKAAPAPMPTHLE